MKSKIIHGLILAIILFGTCRFFYQLGRLDMLLELRQQQITNQLTTPS